MTYKQPPTHSRISGCPIMLGANPVPEVSEVNRAENNTSSDIVNLTWTTSENSTSNSHHQQHDFVCAFYNPDFIIWSSLGSFYIPCVIMIVLYFRIFKVSSRGFSTKLILVGVVLVSTTSLNEKIFRILSFLSWEKSASCTRIKISGDL